MCPPVHASRPPCPNPCRCYTYQPELGGFCWNRQPPFSAVRESTFGAGVLRLINATHASWSWNRNDGKPDQTDDFVMVDRSQPANCPNQFRGGRAAGGPAGARGSGAQPANGLVARMQRAVGQIFSGGRRLLWASAAA